MYNLRYHIASLVAVFLALSVGLLLGTVVVERGVLTNQGTQIVKDLQQEFDDLRKDNADLRTGLERDRLFAIASVPVIVSGTLDGQTVLVLANTGRADGLSATVEAIEQAGGQALVMMAEGESLGIDKVDPELLRTTLAESTDEQATTETPTDATTVDMVTQALAREWTTADAERPVTQLLVSSGAIGMESIPDTATVSAMALIASWDDTADAAGLLLGRKVADLGLPVVGVEAASRVTGVVEAASSVGLSAVDDVTSPQGSVSLVWLLSGRATGYYGIRDGAENVFPPLRITGE